MGRMVRDIQAQKAVILDLRKNQPTTRKKEIPIPRIPVVEPQNIQHFTIADSPETREKFGSSLLLFAALGFGLMIVFNLFSIAQKGVKLKNSLVNSASAGYQKLLAGSQLALQQKNLDAMHFFEQAKKDFETAQKEITHAAPLKSGNSVIAAGAYLSEAASAFLTTAQNLKPLPSRFFEAYKHSPSFSLTPPREKSSLTNILKEEIPRIEFAVQNMTAAAKELAAVNSSLIPRHLQDEFLFSRDLLISLSDRIKRLQETIPGILAALGDREPHRILVLLQNNAELRPTGGFIGSYMLLEMNDGYLAKNEVHDVYQTDYQLKEIIPPPEEIASLTKQWFLRDSNYSADFPLSGEKAAWFLQKEGGPSVDTVMAIDQTLLRDLFSVTGPIYVPELSNFLTAENFSIILSYIIESKIDSLGGKEDPKHILKSFMPHFQKALLAKADVKELAAIFQKAGAEKHLMAYSRLPEVQELFKILEIDGGMKEIKPTDDYLNLVHISIGGNKSDAYIKETFTHDTYFMPGGGIEDELTIEKLHAWNAAEERHWNRTIRSFGFSEISDGVKEVLGRGKNVTFTRVYVPTGSVLLGAEGGVVKTKFDQELGRTYFFTKIETEHGQTSKLTLRYRLPFQKDFYPVNDYRLVVQKQMGTEGARFIKRISPPSRVQNVRFLPSSGFLDENGSLSHDAVLVTDRVFASLWRLR